MSDTWHVLTPKEIVFGLFSLISSGSDGLVHGSFHT